MLTLLLTCSLAVALQDEPVTLQHATPHTFTLGPGDPVLEGYGPSKTFRYEIESKDAVLFVYAESETLDLFLRARIQGGQKASGAAALLSGRRPTPVFEDDDSGGGTTPFLRIDHRGGGALTITVAAKKPATNPPITVHCFEARETPATRAAAASAEPIIAEAQRLGEAGDPGAARATLAELVEALRHTEGAVASDAITAALWSAGFKTHGLGHLGATRDSWSQAHRFRVQTLPDDHPDLQTARGNLAVTLRALGDLPSARALEEKVLSVRSKTLPDDHPELQRAQNNLARTLSALGDLHGARAFQEKVLSVLSQTLPDDHPDLQWARGDLARTLSALGDLHGARALFEKALSVLSQTLPDDHPDLQLARGNLASTLSAMGDLPAARALDEKVLSVSSQTLPDDHPDLQAARNNLAATLKALGDLASARALQEEVLSVLSQTLPEDHPHLQLARGNLAGTLFALGDLPAARALEEKVLSVSSRTLPDDHPDLQLARGNLAGTLFALGDLPAARALFERVLSVCSRTLPEDHPDLQKARGNLAGTLFALGDLASARALQEEVLSVSSQTLPDDHPHLQAARGNLAGTLFALGDLPGARALQEEVLEVRKQTLPEDHPHLQGARGNLAGTLFALGDLASARALFEKVLSVSSLTLPEDHPHLQLARGNLAAALSALGDLPAARALDEKVLAVLSQTLPEDHPDLQAARGNLARTRARMNEPSGSRRAARSLARQTGREAQQFHLFSARELEARVGETRYSARIALSISTGAGVFAPDPEGERLCFSMTEALRAAALQARRVARLWASDLGSEALRAEIVRANREVSRLAGGSEDRDAFSQAIRERDRLERQLLGLIGDSPALAGAYAELDPDSVAGRLGPGEAAIGFWRYGRLTLDPETFEENPLVDSYLAWVLRPGQELQRIELGPAELIEEVIDRWRTTIGAPSKRGVTRAEEGTSEDRSGEAVRGLVIDPLREALGDAKALIIAPADALTLLPFEALPDGDGLLGDRHEVLYRLALSELTVQSPADLNAPSLLAFGGIDYNRRVKPASDDEDRSPQSGSTGGSATALRGKASGRAFSWSFGKLVETRGEALAVSEYFLDAFEDSGVEEPTVLTRKKATRDAFEELAPKHRYLHIATHGWFAPESIASVADDRPIDEKTGLGSFSTLRDQVRGLAPSLLCGLAFAGANGDADAYGRVRGVMTAEEIGAMDLSGVELCVLSACETNVGLRRGGQGIASLQAALHAAGVRTAITSLWKVPDEATRELMDEFYRRIWILEEPKALALWNAKQKLRKQLDEDDQPVYSIRDWAGWVLSGDPN